MNRRSTRRFFGRLCVFILTAGFIVIGLLSVALAVQCVFCSASINLNRTNPFARPGIVDSQYRGIGFTSSGGYLLFGVDIVYGSAKWQVTPAGPALESGVLLEEARSFSFQFPRVSTNPLRGCIPLWLPALVSIVGLVVLRILRRQDPCRGEIACTDCGYDLTGNKSGVCPECGSPVPAALREDEGARPRPVPVSPDRGK